MTICRIRGTGRPGHGRGRGWRARLNTYQHPLLPAFSGAAPLTAVLPPPCSERVKTPADSTAGAAAGEPVVAQCQGQQCGCPALRCTVWCKPAAQAVVARQLESNLQASGKRAAIANGRTAQLSCSVTLPAQPAVFAHTSSDWNALPDLHSERKMLSRSYK